MLSNVFEMIVCFLLSQLAEHSEVVALILGSICIKAKNVTKEKMSSANKSEILSLIHFVYDKMTSE